MYIKIQKLKQLATDCFAFRKEVVCKNGTLPPNSVARKMVKRNVDRQDV
jgi:hypothetical protein